MDTVIRLLPYADAGGPANMAADEMLVRSAAEGIASIRFYGWTSATLSLGYFQPAAVRFADRRLTQLPWVRRPSGGATLVHHHELTYAIALPSGSFWQTGAPWLQRMHRIIAAALSNLGLTDRIAVVGSVPAPQGEVLCFQKYTAGDLLCEGRKVVGSAQRKYRSALMQHGSLLFAQSEHAPILPGIRELAGLALDAGQVQRAIQTAFSADTGWRIEAADWTELENQGIEELRSEKYAMAAWNERR